MAKEEMSVASFLNFSVDNAKRHWLKLIALNLLVAIVMLVSFLLATGPAALAVSWGWHFIVTGLIGIVFMLLAAVIVITCIFGYIKNVVNVARGNAVDFNAFFAVKPLVIVHFIIATLCVFSIVTNGLFILIIPGLIFMFKLWLVPYLVVDREMGFIAAISESWRLTKRYEGGADMLSGLVVVKDLFCGIFVGMSVMMTLSIPIITLLFTIPMACFLSVYPYLALTGQLGSVKINVSGQTAPAPIQAAPVIREGGQALN